jgi:hypothetical protein
MDVGVAGVGWGFELRLLRIGIGACRQFRHSGILRGKQAEPIAA